MLTVWQTPRFKHNLHNRWIKISIMHCIRILGSYRQIQGPYRLRIDRIYLLPNWSIYIVHKAVVFRFIGFCTKKKKIVWLEFSFTSSMRLWWQKKICRQKNSYPTHAMCLHVYIIRICLFFPFEWGENWVRKRENSILKWFSFFCAADVGGLWKRNENYLVWRKLQLD